MNTEAIRKQLHTYLEVADDKKVKAIYALMETDIKQAGLNYTDEVKQELDKRYADYKSGKAKTISAAESKRRIEKLLKSGRNK